MDFDDFWHAGSDESVTVTCRLCMIWDDDDEYLHECRCSASNLHVVMMNLFFNVLTD